MVDDEYRENIKTYTEIENILKYVCTSQTTGYAKLRLAVREFPSDEVNVKTYYL